MKFFVTGVAGQLGHDVMNELHKRGFEGVGSDIAPVYSGIQDHSPVTEMPYVSMDITDARAVENILTQIKTRLPQTRVRMMAYYPVNETDKIPAGGDPRAMFGNRNNRNLPVANEAVRKLAEKMGYEYIDVNDGLTDARGMLRAEFTVEGIHMYANGYRVVMQNLKPYLTGVK